MEDLGYLDDPGNRLGMLDGQCFRAARVVLDIGVHLELEVPATTRSAGGRASWTPSLGWSSCGSTRAMADGVLGSSWTATSAGRARRRRTSSASGSGCRRARTPRQRTGADFDLKAFHRAALDLGSMPLDPLRTALAKL